MQRDNKQELAPVFQEHVLGTIESYVDDIVGAPSYVVDGQILEGKPLTPEKKKEALNAILIENETEFNKKKTEFTKLLVWDNIKAIRDILIHPCPQNRREYTGYYYEGFQKNRTRDGIKQVAFVYDHARLKNMLGEQEVLDNVPTKLGTSTQDLRLKNGRVINVQDILAYNPKKGNAVALHAFEKEGLLGLTAAETPSDYATAEQVRAYICDHITSKIQEIDAELLEEKQKAEFKEEKVPLLLKKGYGSLSSETDKLNFIKELVKCSASDVDLILNRYQYKPGEEEALVNINLLRKDIEEKYNKIITPAIILTSLNRIKNIEEKLLTTNFIGLSSVTEKEQFILALSKRKPLSQINILNQPHVKPGIQDLITYLEKKGNKKLPVEEQLLKCARAVIANKNLYEKSFNELKEAEEKLQFITQLERTDDYERLKKLNQQLAKDPKNLQLLIQQQLSQELKKCINVVHSSTTLQHSFSDIKCERDDSPLEKLQFIYSLMAIPDSAQRRKLLLEQSAKDPGNTQSITDLLHYKQQGCAFSLGNKVPDNKEGDYNGNYVLVNGKQLYYFDRHTGEREEIKIKNSGQFKNVLDIMQKKYSSSPNKMYLTPFDIQKLIIQNTVLPKKEDPAECYFSSSSHYRACLKDMAIIVQGEADYKSEKQYQEVTGVDQRQQFVMNLLLQKPEDREKFLFSQYAKNPKNIQQLFGSLTTPGSLREDFYKTFPNYEKLLEEVGRILSMDVILKRNFSELKPEEKKVFILGLVNTKDPDDRLFILNMQAKKNIKNANEIRAAISPSNEQEVNFSKKNFIELYMGEKLTISEEGIYYKTNSELADDDISHRTCLSKYKFITSEVRMAMKPREVLNFPFSSYLFIPPTTDFADLGKFRQHYFRLLSCGSGCDYVHEKYVDAHAEKKPTLWQVEYVIGLLMADGKTRNESLNKHGEINKKLLLEWLNTNPTLWPFLNKFGSVKRLKNIIQSEMTLEQTSFNPLMSVVYTPEQKQKASQARETAAMVDPAEASAVINKLAVVLLAYIAGIETALPKQQLPALLITHLQSPKAVKDLLNYINEKKLINSTHANNLKEKLSTLSLLIIDNSLSAVRENDQNLVAQELTQLGSLKSAIDIPKLNTKLKEFKETPKTKEAKQKNLIAPINSNSEIDHSDRVEDIYLAKMGDSLRTVKIGNTTVQAGVCSITGYRAEQQDRVVLAEAPYCQLLNRKQIDDSFRETLKLMQEEHGKAREGLEAVGTTVTANAAWREKGLSPGDPDTVSIYSAQIGDSDAFLVTKNKKSGKVTIKKLTGQAHTRENKDENERIIQKSQELKKPTFVGSPTRVGEERLGKGYGSILTRGIGNTAYEQDGLTHDPVIFAHIAPISADEEAFTVTFSDGAMEVKGSHTENQASRDQRAIKRLEDIFKDPSTSTEAAFKIADKAMEEGSTDNITISVVPIGQDPVFSAVLDGNGGMEVVEDVAKNLSNEFNYRIQTKAHQIMQMATPVELKVVPEGPSKIKELEGQINELRKELKMSQEVVRELTSSFSITEPDEKKSFKEIQELKEKNKNLERRLIETERKAGDAVERLNKIQTTGLPKIKELEGQISKLKIELSTSQSLVSELTASFPTTMSDEKTSIKENQELKERNEQLERQATEAKNKVGTAQEELWKIQNEKKALGEKHDREVKDVQEKLKVAQEQIERLEQKNVVNIENKDTLPLTVAPRQIIQVATDLEKIEALKTACTNYKEHLERKNGNSESKEETMVQTKLRHINTLLAKLRDGDLKGFEKSYRDFKAVLAQRRDSATIAFLKSVASLLLFTVVPVCGLGYFLIRRIWKVEGEELTKEIDKEMKEKKPGPG